MGWPSSPWLVRSAMAAPMRYQLLPVLPVMRFIRGMREDWSFLQPAVAKPDSSAAITQIAEIAGADLDGRARRRGGLPVGDRRLHIYHNTGPEVGALPGDIVTLREEREKAGGGGGRGGRANSGRAWR